MLDMLVNGGDEATGSGDGNSEGQIRHATYSEHFLTDSIVTAIRMATCPLVERHRMTMIQIEHNNQESISYPFRPMVILQIDEANFYHDDHPKDARFITFLVNESTGQTGIYIDRHLSPAEIELASINRFTIYKNAYFG